MSIGNVGGGEGGKSSELKQTTTEHLEQKKRDMGVLVQLRIELIYLF